MMKLEIRAFREDTLDDFKEVVRSRFSESTTVLADKVIANPVRVPGMDSGAVGYVDGQPACIRASIVRRIFWGQEPFLGVVGGMLAKKHGTDRTLLKNIVKNSIAPRNGSKIFFTNTSVVACVKLNKEAGVEGQGPGQWNFRRVVVFRPFLRKWMLFANIHPRVPKPHFRDFQFRTEELILRELPNGLVLRREAELKDAEIDEFWSRYLRLNKGLVSSRTAAEIRWTYGDRLRKNAVFISLRGPEGLVGYVVASFSGRTGVEWRIIDWIALDNSLQDLETLMREMIDYLRHHTPAVELKISGFPNYVQPLLDKFPAKQEPIGHNPYLFHCYDPELKEKIESAEQKSHGWFWGPYDGDMCME